MHVCQGKSCAAGNVSCSLQSCPERNACAFLQVNPRYPVRQRELKSQHATLISAAASSTLHQDRDTDGHLSEVSAEKRSLQTARSQTTPSAPTADTRRMPRQQSDGKSNLFNVLLESAALQAFTQVQNTIDQVQQTATKLTKGLRPRPPGYPPGTTCTSQVYLEFVTSHLTRPQECSCSF